MDSYYFLVFFCNPIYSHASVVTEDVVGIYFMLCRYVVNHMDAVVPLVVKTGNGRTGVGDDGI